jgi:hypothetical protein
MYKTVSKGAIAIEHRASHQCKVSANKQPFIQQFTSFSTLGCGGISNQAAEGAPPEGDRASRRSSMRKLKVTESK